MQPFLFIFNNMKSTLLLCILGLLLTAAKPLSEIELVKKRVLSERVEILIPKGFEVMTEQQMDFAYAKAQSRPSVIFTNNNLISLAFNYSDNDADQDMVDVYAASFGKTYHATGWKVGYCVAPPALSTELRRVQAAWASGASNVVIRGCWLCRQMNVYIPRR